MSASRRIRAGRASVALLAAVMMATACGDSEAGQNAESGSTGGQRGEIIVSAAASLTDAFTDMAEAFEDAHPGVAIRLDLGPSSGLVAKIADGAPVDVLAVADTETMDAAGDDGLLADPAEPFARNRMQLAVPVDNPGQVDSLEDLADPDRVIALCAPEVPCGRLARRILDQAGVVPSLDSEEPDVRSLLTKITSGDVDAGLVYRTDALAAGDDVATIDLPKAVDLSTEYPIATVKGAPEPGLADQFIDFVLSDTGQGILDSHGFGPA